MTGRTGIPNFNGETGHYHGVIDPRADEWLESEIIDNGESIDYANWKAEVKESIASMLSGLDMDPDKGSTLVEDIFDVINDTECPEFEEEDYEYDSAEWSGILGHLGGAPLVHVCKSDWITKCLECSPCVPGAGNLDEPATPGNGKWAHCFPPEGMQSFADANDVVYYMVQLSTMKHVTVRPVQPK